MRKSWKTIVLAVMVAAIGLSLVAAAYGATKTTKNAKKRGGCAALMSNPQAVKDMQALRAEHQKEMQAWWDKYGADPTNAEAQAALKELRLEHREDMRQLFKKYGVTWRGGAGPGACGGGMMGAGAGGCGGAAGSGGCAGPGSAGGAGGGCGGGMMGGWSY